MRVADGGALVKKEEKNEALAFRDEGGEFAQLMAAP